MATGKQIAEKINPKKKSHVPSFDIDILQEEGSNQQPSEQESLQSVNPSGDPVATPPSEPSYQQPSNLPQQPNQSKKAVIAQKREQLLKYFQKPTDAKSPKTISITQAADKKLNNLATVFGVSSSVIIDNLIIDIYQQYEEVIKAEIKGKFDI